MKVAALAVLLAFPSVVLALGMEKFGNAPVVKQSGWADGVLEVANLKSRVYTYWVNGNESFFYKGDAKALNEALRKFAAVKDDGRRVILLPGQGKTQSFERKPVAFEWQFHVPSGIYRAMSGQKHVVLTVYINAAKPRGRPDRQQVKKWIDELDSDSFETRQKAEQELRKLKYEVKPFLREALKGQPALEARRRMERLLESLAGFDVDDLEIPKGLTVVSVDDQLDEHFKGLKLASPEKAGLAMHGLSNLVAYSDRIVPALVGMLAKEKHEYLRLVAASTLARIGAEAKYAIPALKEGLNDPDVNVRKTFKDALDTIEKARREPGEEDEIKRKRAILKDITEWKKGREGKGLESREK
jgi:hypothetical protein